MAVTYSNFSEICTKFYDLVVDPIEVANFVCSKISDHNHQKCLFVGSFFLVADELQKLGIEIVLADYSKDMICEAKRRFPNTRAEVADLRNLPFRGDFDAIIVIGRVFTHMLTCKDSAQALISMHKALKPGGVVLIDNYEDTKIQTTNYFNGSISVENSAAKITRESSTDLISEDPMIVNWKAVYRATLEGNSVVFEDEILHRAFSRSEIYNLFEAHDFKVISQGDNFDETSFYTVASHQ
jgi:SAM-dependent methyltransferase